MSGVAHPYNYALASECILIMNNRSYVLEVIGTVEIKRQGIYIVIKQCITQKLTAN